MHRRRSGESRRGERRVVEPARALRLSGRFLHGFPAASAGALQAPLYYYALAPIARAVDSHRTVFALRMASVAFLLVAVLFTYLAVRVSAPERPLAAGLAAIVLGTMSGLTFVLSQVQNCALLIAMFAVVYWLMWREFRNAARDTGSRPLREASS